MTTTNKTPTTRCPLCNRLVAVVSIATPAGDAPAFEMHRTGESRYSPSCAGSLAKPTDSK